MQIGGTPAVVAIRRINSWSLPYSSPDVMNPILAFAGILEFPSNSGQCLAVGLVMRALVLGWGDIPQCRVPPNAVIERLDVLEDARLCLGAGGVVLVVNQFLLQTREEALH